MWEQREVDKNWGSMGNEIKMASMEKRTAKIPNLRGIANNSSATVDFYGQRYVLIVKEELVF